MKAIKRLADAYRELANVVEQIGPIEGIISLERLQEIWDEPDGDDVKRRIAIKLRDFADLIQHAEDAQNDV